MFTDFKIKHLTHKESVWLQFKLRLLIHKNQHKNLNLWNFECKRKMGIGFSRQNLQIHGLPNEDIHILIRQYDDSFLRLGFKNWQRVITKYCLLLPIFVGAMVVTVVVTDYYPKYERLRILYKGQCMALMHQDGIISTNNRSIDDLKSSLKSKKG